jgi:uncharacterized protein (DUF736 family)
MLIGNFALAKDGGWIGFVHTLTIHTKIHLIPNDDRSGNTTPAFHIIAGNARIGEAWEAKSIGSSPKPYLRLRLDDPLFPEPLSAALFPSDTGNTAQLVWNRKGRG